MNARGIMSQIPPPSQIPPSTLTDETREKITSALALLSKYDGIDFFSHLL